MEKVAETQDNLNNVQQYVDFVKENLQPLADHLKVGIDWLWQILVMQARVEAIVYLIVSIALSITTLFLIITFWRNFKRGSFGGTEYINKDTGEKHSRSEYYGDMSGKIRSVQTDTDREGTVAYVTGIMAAVFIMITTITTGSNIGTIVTGLVNPEFRAIEKIVEFAKPKVEEVSKEVK